jgi:hypothetical protein
MRVSMSKLTASLRLSLSPHSGRQGTGAVNGLTKYISAGRALSWRPEMRLLNLTQLVPGIFRGDWSVGEVGARAGLKSHVVKARETPPLTCIALEFLFAPGRPVIAVLLESCDVVSQLPSTSCIRKWQLSNTRHGASCRAFRSSRCADHIEVEMQDRRSAAVQHGV